MIGTILWLVGVIAAIWVIINVWNSKMKIELKVLWSVAAIFLNVFAAIAYYFLHFHKKK